MAAIIHPLALDSQGESERRDFACCDLSVAQHSYRLQNEPDRVLSLLRPGLRIDFS